MCPTVFNGQLHVLGRNIDTNKDPFRMSISRGGMVPDRTVIEGPESILKRAFGPFFTKLAHNFQDGFIELMKYDHMTTRDYLREKIGLDFYSIWYMETVARLALSPSQTQLSSIFADYHFHQSASGLYDQSLSEAVLDAMDFEYPTTSGEEVQWYRVAGGTYQVIEKMEKRISTRPSLGARVTSIAYQSHESSQPMLIHVDGETQSRKYSAVFNTASLPCMRRMNIGPGTLRPGQQAAIQSVHYDASTKIAIKFKSAWWTRYCQIQGGQASTDLPIRTCVYPSPETNSEAPSRVLLCSYTWGQDAQQMASLIGSDTGGSELEQLLRHNLALLHQNYVDPLSGRPFGHEKMLRIIQDEYEEYHAYDWYSDPCASGAFSYFGPEQFRHFYPELVRPAANGHMFLVGEACSAHHAWISGSLDSAYRGLVQYLHKLIAEGRVAPHVLHELQASWGALDEIPGEVLEWQMYLTQMSMS
ncbi:hypothetical protein N7517_004598 [Penicillium concentricum]|uniref:Amine oxidase domain-containing protein n=1 Tax=Penicillium concentricum TaxID=293559 RepID=A0A9W9S5T1_9EURO|nr:uncharacterized protein N7517_004598 [Penicillium concentricum]KAJ5372592.1 hypothetical protein N7517_004598 [Penicillium concentricum]